MKRAESMWSLSFKKLRIQIWRERAQKNINSNIKQTVIKL